MKDKIRGWSFVIFSYLVSDACMSKSELEMNESTKSPQAEPAHVPKRACFPQAEPSQYSSLAKAITKDS